MNDLIFEKTKSSPAINFNFSTGKCSLIGSSYPEDANAFYMQIYDWIRDYFSNSNSALEIEIKLDYLNSSSITFISELIYKLDKYSLNDKSIRVFWYHYSDDEEIKELGEDLKSEVKFSFELISY